MARRELISKNIEEFDNSPINYNTWKAAFKNMVREVKISPSKELALMIEYTTGESKRLIQRLRNAYIVNPTEGVKESWKKLGERFGSTAVITQVHLSKLTMFPSLSAKDNKGLLELGDLLFELQCAKEDGALSGLKILDEPAFLKPLIIKLPEDVQGRWQRHAYRYKSQHGVDYPPFNEFALFIQELAKKRNDLYLAIESPERRTNAPKSSTAPPPKAPVKPTRSPPFRSGLTIFKTEVSEPTYRQSAPRDPAKWCVIHKLSHALGKCRAFRAMPLTERKNVLDQHGICFRCVTSSSHQAKDCTVAVKCMECQSEKHVTALHIGPSSGPDSNTRAPERPADPHRQGGEPSNVTARCTEVCGNTAGGRSCSKICPAFIYWNGQPKNKIKAYVVIDDQGNCSLAKSKLFNMLNLEGEATPYMLKTCSGTSQVQGRRAHNLVVESLDNAFSYALPALTECDAIPDIREEIPTPSVARAHPHLASIADKIPALDANVEVLLLIGKDAPALHKIHEFRNGPRDAPWAQRLNLGWVVLGNACLDGAHKPTETSCFRTQVLDNGRPSLLQPCTNRFYIRHDSSAGQLANIGVFLNGTFEDGFGAGVFVRTKNVNKPGPSVG